MDKKKRRVSRHHSRRERDAVPGREKMRRMGPVVNESGVVNERATWPTLVVVVHTEHRDLRYDFFQFCKKHHLEYFPVDGDYPGDNEQWPFKMAFQVSGGKALERLGAVVPPDFVLDWYYVVDSGPPRFGTRSSGVNRAILPRSFVAPVLGHGRKPARKDRVFKYDEVSRHEYDVVMDAEGNPEYVKTPARCLVVPCKWEELSDEQRVKLGCRREDVVKIEWIEKRFFNKDVLVLHAWLLGCTKPLRWSNDAWKECD